jgi:hypothetical protein
MSEHTCTCDRPVPITSLHRWGPITCVRCDGWLVCECCGRPARYAIQLSREHDRFYIPSHIARHEWPWSVEEVSFCRPCMRAIEDGLRASVAWLRTRREQF